MKLRKELKQVLHYAPSATDDQLIDTLLKMATDEFKEVWALFREARGYRKELGLPRGELLMCLPLDTVGEIELRASLALGESWEISPDWILRYSRDLYERGRTERYDDQLADRDDVRKKLDRARRLNALNADHSTVLADRLNEVSRSVAKAKVGK